MAQRAGRSLPLEVVDHAAAASPIDEPVQGLVALTARYGLRRPEKVVAFLRRYPHRMPVLLQAAAVIPRSFGADVELVLQVDADPEGEAQHDALFAIVRTKLGFDDANDRFDHLLEWWLDTVPDGPGVLVIDLESA